MSQPPAPWQPSRPASRDIELATCLYIVYDPATGHARIASAGHLPPLILHPGGHIDTVTDVLGIPLGVGGHPFDSTDIALPEGAVLALYTDGLIESPGRSIDEGLAAARTALTHTLKQTDTLEESADHILSALLPHPPTDDTVLVLARIHHHPTTSQTA
ncbi:PP2C family protein-serine/threonine phosphatase [Streptomyces sp. NPDC015237]|uniref:PP2C family protein-serine/threonine phosphatase n=1 Tax=Streptomyces sp. NPDC015237 TaxID=3364949 RepID=UPI0036F4CF7F